MPGSAMPRHWDAHCHLAWPRTLPAPGGGYVRRCREGINKLVERQAHKFRLFFLRLSNLCLSQGCKTAFIAACLMVVPFSSAAVIYLCTLR